jgi:HAD domain in Swiss Army Knife RNA repair proteins
MIRPDLTYAPPGPLIFLDIDGCLNNHTVHPDVKCGEIHPEKVMLINTLMKHTGANFVLSSAWRYFIYRGEMNLAGLEWLLRSHGFLADRLLGIARADRDVPRPPYNGVPSNWQHTHERGQQITDWLTQFAPHKPPYVVIDDLDLGISAAGHPFVETDGAIGLTAADTVEALRILRGE